MSNKRGSIAKKHKGGLSDISDVTEDYDEGTSDV